MADIIFPGIPISADSSPSSSTLIIGLFLKYWPEICPEACYDTASAGHTYKSLYNYLHGFSVGYLTPAGWLYPISSTGTPMYLNTSKRAFP